MTPRDLFAKLQRELGNLESAVSADAYFDFVITAYHLCDWIKNDSAAPASARSALAALRKQLPVKICRDLANGSKHFTLDYADVVVADATCVAAYGSGRFGKGAYGVGEPTIRITLADGAVLDGLSVARDAVQLWDQFFSSHVP